jgi:hypothetical protein
MSFEFVHTSVAKGLRGDSGFAVAVATRGLPPALEPALAELSAYDFDGNRAVGADAIDWAHRILSVAGRSYTVLSRTAPCGSDWSGRPNRARGGRPRVDAVRVQRLPRVVAGGR